MYSGLSVTHRTSINLLIAFDHVRSTDSDELHAEELFFLR